MLKLSVLACCGLLKLLLLRVYQSYVCSNICFGIILYWTDPLKHWKSSGCDLLKCAQTRIWNIVLCTNSCFGVEIIYFWCLFLFNAQTRVLACLSPGVHFGCLEEMFQSSIQQHARQNLSFSVQLYISNLLSHTHSNIIYIYYAQTTIWDRKHIYELMIKVIFLHVKCIIIKLFKNYFFNISMQELKFWIKFMFSYSFQC